MQLFVLFIIRMGSDRIRTSCSRIVGRGIIRNRRKRGAGVRRTTGRFRVAGIILGWVMCVSTRSHAGRNYHIVTTSFSHYKQIDVEGSHFIDIQAGFDVREACARKNMRVAHIPCDARSRLISISCA